MITRPLDLASRLRPEPRSFDWLFYVNIGVIVLFFSVFGSRFVLAPGLGVNFQVPVLPGAVAGAVVTTHRITVLGPDLVYVNEGSMNFRQLAGWLEREAKKVKQPSLLVLIVGQVPTTAFTDISQAARAAGFVNVQLGAQEPATAPGRGR